jgi:hypothetical protein
MKKLLAAAAALAVSFLAFAPPASASIGGIGGPDCVRLWIRAFETPTPAPNSLYGIMLKTYAAAPAYIRNESRPDFLAESCHIDRAFVEVIINDEAGPSETSSAADAPGPSDRELDAPAARDQDVSLGDTGPVELKSGLPPIAVPPQPTGSATLPVAPLPTGTGPVMMYDKGLADRAAWKLVQRSARRFQNRCFPLGGAAVSPPSRFVQPDERRIL